MPSPPTLPCAPWPDADTLSAVLSSLPTAVVGLDLHRRIRLWNTAAEQLFGGTATERIGFPSLLHTANPPAFDTQAITEAEVERQTWDHRCLRVQVRTAPVHSGTQIVGVIEHYTPLPTPTNDLQATFERRYAALVEHSCDSLALIDCTAKILFIGAGIERRTGYTAIELEGQSGFAYIHSDDHARIQSELAACVATPHERRDVQFRFRHRDQSWRILSGTAVNRLTDPSIAAIVLNLRDITTEQVRADEWSATVERFDEMMAAIPCAVYQYEVTADGTQLFPYVSSGAQAIWNASPSAVVANPTIPLSQVHPDDVARVWATIQQSAENLQPWTAEYRTLQANNRYRWVNGIATPRRAPNGVRWSGVIMDIHQLKTTQEWLATQNRILNALARRHPQTELLTELALALERQAPDMVVSIFWVDAEQRLRLGAAPSFPDHYNRAVDGIRCGPEVGSCGRAAALGIPVVCRDLLNDPYWKQYHELVLSTDLRSCWSLPLKNQTGQVLGVMGMYYQHVGEPTPHDEQIIEQASHLAVLIMEHWRTIDELHANAARFQALVENAFEVVSMWDANGTVLYDSPPASRMLGKASPIQVGHSGFRLIHPNDLERAKTDFRNFVNQRDGLIVDYRVRLVLADGRVRQMELTIRNLLHNPIIAAIVINWRDVTDRAEAEQAVRTQAQQLSLALSAAQLGLWDWDIVRGCVVCLNMAAVLGTPVNDVPLELLRRWIHLDDQGRFDQHLRQLILEGTYWNECYRLQPPDQPVRWVQVRGEVFRSEEGRAQRLLCILGDRTAQRQLEQQLLQAQKMEAVGRLAGGVAHDFNNLLTVITGYTSFLLDDTPPESLSHGALSEIAASAQRATELTRQLLIFSRNQPLVLQTLDLNQVLQSHLRLLGRLVQADIALQVELTSEPLWVLADRSQLEQVVMNLALNASDAMPTGGRLLVRTHVSGPPPIPLTAAASNNFVCLVVEDNGCGMDEATRERAFEPFFSTKPESKGTGLGLAIVYAIVQRFGGAIQLHTVLGQGTRFAIFLPMTQRPRLVMPTTQSTPASAGQERILLVEDEDGVRALSRRVLERRGYTVLQARNGAEALALWGQEPEPIDLVVTDMVMPLVNGRDLVNRLRALCPHLRVLFMTGYTEEHFGAANDFAPQILRKPFTPEQLATAVREVLDREPLKKREQAVRAVVILLVWVSFATAQAPRERLTVPPHLPRVYNERLRVHWLPDQETLCWKREQPSQSEYVFLNLQTHATQTEHTPPRGWDRPPARPVEPKSRWHWPTTIGTPWSAPNGERALVIHDHNVGLQIDAGLVTMLTTDGTAARPYNRAFWSPDSRYAVVCRMKVPERRLTHTIESSPRVGGRAILHSFPYPLPGDPFPEYELHLFDVERAKEIPLAAPVVDFGQVILRWGDDQRTFVYVKRDRGHQRFRLIEVDTRTGQSRALIDEQSATFIWSYGNIGLDDDLFTWLDKTDEIIYLSERSGWRHLWLVDGRVGRVLHPITTGEWVVRGVHHIDPERREIWFSAGGREPGHDPYWLHHYRINFDGSGLVRLTDGPGTHSVQYSPDRRYLIDTWSRVDHPPVHSLRDARSGELVQELTTANITEIESVGWAPPEHFVAKGRDGVTDIYGIICRPANFNPRKVYPVIEYIYAGPHSAHVPKAFRSARFFSDLTDLGFVVVQIDGMGTAHRSKAFHDVCWHNLKDAGFPDRIAWHRAVAAKYPWYDLRRVGIYGTSAGGQNALGALLFHGDFYHAAMAACGCHDNRLDKASWNEQWMGYPVGPHYAASSNVVHAQQLRGKLLLIVGELDRNVPPESTYRVADALIKAGKDFDLLVVPGLGHSDGGAYGNRRMQDFFLKHLQGKEPPNRNRGSSP